MKIAVIGSNGFVGRNVFNFLKLKNHNVQGLNRNNIDLLDPKQVNFWLKSNRPNIIINCAAIMKDNNSINDCRNNLAIFINLFNNAHLFDKFIDTGSGAEFDRTTNIENASIDKLFDSIPLDSYGFGQNIKSRMCRERENFYTLRIFNCFGRGELNTRIIPKFLTSKNTFKIFDDRYFDYFGIQDLNAVVEHYVDNDVFFKDINTVYMKKVKISEMLKLYCEIHNISVNNFEIESVSNLNYTGDGTLLNNLGLKLLGLEECLKRY